MTDQKKLIIPKRYKIPGVVYKDWDDCQSCKLDHNQYGKGYIDYNIKDYMLFRRQ